MLRLHPIYVPLVGLRASSREGGADFADTTFLREIKLFRRYSIETRITCAQLFLD